MKLLLLPALIAGAMLFPSHAGSHPLPHHHRFASMTLDQREHFQLRSIRHAKGVVRTWQRLRLRGLASASVPRIVYWHKHQARWLRRELRETRAIKRAVAREAARRAAARAAPSAYSGSWTSAVAAVQAWYPGTSGWLLSCSASEGGWGGFVMNRQGSGAGGWMQYMAGTFYGDWGAATADLSRRGIAIPVAGSWGNPLAQAIAAAWARYTGNAPSSKWTGSGC